MLEKGAKVGPGFRDMLDNADIVFLSMAELWAESCIQEGMEQGMHYKHIYEVAKNRVEHYALMNLPVMAAKKRRQLSA